MNEFIVISRLVTNLPVDLRNIVIHPTLVYPIKDVGIKVVVVLKSVRLTAGNISAILLVMENAKGTYAKLHPGLCAVNGG